MQYDADFILFCVLMLLLKIIYHDYFQFPFNYIRSSPPPSIIGWERGSSAIFLYFQPHQPPTISDYTYIHSWPIFRPKIKSVLQFNTQMQTLEPPLEIDEKNPPVSIQIRVSIWIVTTQCMSIQGSLHAQAGEMTRDYCEAVLTNGLMSQFCHSRQ